MLKSSVLGSLVFVPALMVGCGSDGSTDGASAGAGGGNSAGASAAGMHSGGMSSGGMSSGGMSSGGMSSGGMSSGGMSSGGANSAGTSASGTGGLNTTGGGGGSSGATVGAAGDNAAAGDAMGGAADMAGAAGSGAGGTGGGLGGTSGGGGASAGHAGTGGGTVCTTNAQCAGSQVCIASFCTPCDGVVFSGGSTVYFVDPVNGSDSNGTGSGKSGGQVANACAYKTVTRALQVIGSPTQASGAIVKLKGNASAATGETFPISVPQYVVIQGATGPVTVTLAAAKVGFSFDGTGSVLKDLVLEGGGTSDVGVRLPTAGASATLDSVTVQNTAATGVDVLAGTLTLLAGTTIQMAGTAQARQEGITVEGTGKLVAKLTSGKVSIIKNTAQGVHVLGQGSVDLEGVVTSNTGVIPTSYAGTIVISQNYQAEVELNQTGATPPLNTLKGVLATGSVVSDGLLVFGGSAAYVRKSVFVGNGLSGIHLSHTGSRATGNNDVTAVDLGKASDLGLNVVQGGNDQLNNNGAGICINLDPAQTLSVNAQGNAFAPGDCSAVTVALTKNLGACTPTGSKPLDVGWEWVTNMNTTKVTVDTTKCN